MDEAIKDLVATAKKIQDAAAGVKMQASADACLIAASNLATFEVEAVAAESAKPKK